MALFERDDERLTPVELPRRDRFDDDLLTILKYSGKTNEVFTKLLLNVTVWSGAEVGGRPLKVLDPMCGRGTTLNQVLMNGWHALGLDLDERDFDAYAAFLRSWLTTKRLKHSAEVTPVRRDGAKLGRRFHAEVGATKEEWKAGEAITVDYVNADTLHTRAVHKAAVGRRGRDRRPLRRPARQPLRWPARAQPARPAPRGRPRLGRGAAARRRDRASRGTPTWPAATTPWRCWPTPVSSRSTTGPTAVSCTASTRRSSATSWWRASRANLSSMAAIERPGDGHVGPRPDPAPRLGRGPAQGCGDPPRGRGGGPHRPRRARRAARGGVRRQDLRRPGPDHRRPAGPRDEQRRRSRGAR